MLPNINVILGPHLVLGRFPKETRGSISTVRLGGSSEARQPQMSSLVPSHPRLSSRAATITAAVRLGGESRIWLLGVVLPILKKGG
jgi:hypothetical protein